MNAVVGAAFVLVVGAACFSAGWVLRDAQARGIPTRKAYHWSALQFIEWPLFLWLYRRTRPKRVREPDGGRSQESVASRATMGG
jgi:hypothetical protein